MKNGVFPRYARFIDFSEAKTEEYTSVFVVSMASRAAIDAGIDSETSFQVSALYLRKIASANRIEEWERIRWDALVAFTKLVEEHRSSGKTGLYIEESKQYIAANIFKKISVKDVAEELNLNPVYLERIFKQSVGVTMGDYIQREKIEKARNLLRYSDRPLIEIGEYLGFSSQSYFGKVFKKETGMTPRQYQVEYKMSKY